MTETGQNFEMYQGETKQLRISVVDENGDALDLSSYTQCNWVIYKQTGKATVLTKTLGAGITYTGAGNDIIQIDLDPTDTENVAPSTYLHECEISDAGGTNVSIVCTGTFKILYSKL